MLFLRNPAGARSTERREPRRELRRAGAISGTDMAQPIYVTLASTGSSPWKLANREITPQQVSFAVLSTGGSSWAISVCYEDPSGTFQSPNYASSAGSTAVTAFTLLAGSSNQVVTIGASLAPIAGFQFALNTQSSAGARVTLVSLQAGNLQ
jgi:hypothetical protein